MLLYLKKNYHLTLLTYKGKALHFLEKALTTLSSFWLDHEQSREVDTSILQQEWLAWE